jgi:5-methylcytosine-specific restriction endonuclease McrA
MNPMLINVLERKVLELEAASAEVPRDALKAHNSRLYNARMSLARARGGHTCAEWDAIVAETGHICVRCGEATPHPRKGHIVPIADGGTDAADNLMPLCGTCISARGGEGIDWLAAWRETGGRQSQKGGTVTPIREPESPGSPPP